jgi:coenzyme A diphosphatase NUDT7
MNIAEISKRISAIKAEDLIGENEMVKAAVLIPLILREGHWHILFEERSRHLRSQPGDICFPGGKMEATDRSPREAAIRETCEELGIRPEDLFVVGTLGRYLPSSQLIVHPYVACLQTETFTPSAEVETLFTVPLDWLLKTEPERYAVKLQPLPEDGFPFEKIVGGKAYQWRERQIIELFYHYQDHTIWGLTARILHHFLKILRA